MNYDIYFNESFAPSYRNINVKRKTETDQKIHIIMEIDPTKLVTEDCVQLSMSTGTKTTFKTPAQYQKEYRQRLKMRNMAKTSLDLERAKAYRERQRAKNKTSPKKKKSPQSTAQRQRKWRARIAEAADELQSIQSTNAQQQPENIAFNLQACETAVTTAKIYPDPQSPSTSAATTSVTTAKTPSTRQCQKRKRIACNPPATPEIRVLPQTQRKHFIGKTSDAAITSLESQSSQSVSKANNNYCPTSQLPISDNNLAISLTEFSSNSTSGDFTTPHDKLNRFVSNIPVLKQIAHPPSTQLVYCDKNISLFLIGTPPPQPQ